MKEPGWKLLTYSKVFDDLSNNICAHNPPHFNDIVKFFTSTAKLTLNFGRVYFVAKWDQFITPTTLFT